MPTQETDGLTIDEIVEKHAEQRDMALAELDEEVEGYEKDRKRIEGMYEIALLLEQAKDICKECDISLMATLEGVQDQREAYIGKTVGVLSNDYSHLLELVALAVQSEGNIEELGRAIAHSRFSLPFIIGLTKGKNEAFAERNKEEEE